MDSFVETKIDLEIEEISEAKSTHLATKKIVLNWNNINVYTPHSNIDTLKKCFGKKVPENKQIIKNGILFSKQTTNIKIK